MFKKLVKKTENYKIHIEKPYSFLLICKTERNSKFEKLLWGFPSYIIFYRFSQEEKKLLETIVEDLQKQYNKVLILELSENKKQKAIFGIYEKKYGELYDLIQVLKDSLTELKTGDNTIKVYKTKKSPPIKNKNLYYLNISIKPIYKQNGTFLPYDFRKLHHVLNVAIKKSLFYFLKHYTNVEVKHYLSIGKKFFNKTTKSVDKRLSSITDRFDFLLLITPVNIEQAWHEFKKHNFLKPPEFLYRPIPFEVSHLKKELFSINIDNVEDPVLFEIFSKKRDEIDIQLSIIEARGLKKALWLSLFLYEEPSEELVNLSKEILEKEYLEENEERTITAKELARMAEEEITYYKKFLPSITSKVKIREDIVARALVSNGNLFIYKYSKFTEKEAVSLIHHEIGTHILTYFNGMQQPFKLLHTGLNGYEELQEGLAILSEYFTDTLSLKRFRILAARVLASKILIDGADFIQVFRSLVQYGFSPREAFMITARVFRGGGFIKDAVYLRGFLKLIDFIKNNTDIYTLYTGKFSFEHIPLIKELIEREVIKRPVLIPRYLEKSKLERLKRISAEKLIGDLK